MKIFFTLIFFVGISFSQTDTNVIPPKIIKPAVPVYPTEARRNNISGTIWLKVLVDTFGIPKEVIVSKSSNEIFNEPSIAAAKQYRFNPASKNSKAFESWTMIPFNFYLNQPHGHQKKE